MELKGGSWGWTSAKVHSCKTFLVLLHVISASSLPGVYQEHIAVCSNIQPVKKNRLPVAVWRKRRDRACNCVLTLDKIACL